MPCKPDLTGIHCCPGLHTAPRLVPCPEIAVVTDAHAHGFHQPADHAQRLFDSMMAAGLVPAMETWSALLNAYAESRQPQGAVQALMGMRRAGFQASVKVRMHTAAGRTVCEVHVCDDDCRRRSKRSGL
jgi:pentatricopeptide repeat protein